MKIALALLFILQLHSIQLQLENDKEHLKNNRMLTTSEKTKKKNKEMNQNLKIMEMMMKNMTGVLTTMTNFVNDVQKQNEIFKTVKKFMTDWKKNNKDKEWIQAIGLKHLFEYELPIMEYIRDRLETVWNATHTLENSLNPIIKINDQLKNV
uniref:SJCHGC03182 protein n=1 Tax=Schistosoma japonicum TaxID=6182 RepID=Q5DHJ1_SCHJA|nr:SJCHGC03182 protein [Schistosoma japonicum]